MVDDGKWYLRQIPRAEVANVIAVLFDYYKANKQIGETMGQYHRRIGLIAIVAYLKTHEKVAPLMEPLSQLYGARAAGAPFEAIADGASMLNVQVPNNYSPTAFMVAAMGDASTRTMEYVATVTFVNGATYDKAKLLAQNPVP